MIYANEETMSDARMEQVIKAIENKDREALKLLFSEKALSEAADIDGHIDYLFDLVEGDNISWERETLSAGKSAHYGKVVKMTRSWYFVSTDQEDYLFFMLEYTKDTEYPENIGLYALRGIRKADKETQLTYWQDMMIPGVYRPEE